MLLDEIGANISARPRDYTIKVSSKDQRY